VVVMVVMVVVVEEERLYLRSKTRGGSRIPYFYFFKEKSAYLSPDL
jgi:hypothetical protein